MVGMLAHIAGFALLLAAWLACITGWGLWLAKAFGCRRDAGLAFGDFGLLGLFLFAAIATLQNFVLPVGGWSSVPLLLGGWALLARERRRAWAAWTLAGGFGIAAPMALLLAAFAVWLAAPNTLTLYDDGLYHFQAAQAAQDFPVILGHANLHGRFGFNSLWMPASAALALPGVEMLSSVTGPSLAGILALSAIAQRCALWWPHRREVPASLIFGLGTLAVAPFMLLLVRPNNMGNDLAPALLVLLCFLVSLHVVETEGDRTSARGTNLLALAVAYAGFAALLKLSCAPVALLPLFLMLALRELVRRPVIAAAGFGFVLGLAWLARGVMLSGCFVYPVWATCFPELPWTVDRALAADELAYIQSWARTPVPGLPAAAVLADHAWLGRWVLRTFNHALTLTLGLLTIWAAANFLIFRRATPPVPSARRRRRLHLGIVAVAGLATLYWFVNAPDPRFGFGSFTALALALLAFSFRDVLPRPPARLARLAAHRSALAVVAVAAVVLGGAALQSARGSKGLAAQPPTVELGEITMADGTVVRYPREGDRCWAAPYPCAANPETLGDLRFGKIGPWPLIVRSREP